MEKEDLIEFLKDHLRVRISKEMHTQMNDYEYTEKLQVSLVLEDGFDSIEIDRDFITLDSLNK